MDIPSILREIDSEIEKLHRMRVILRNLMGPLRPAPRRIRKVKPPKTEQPMTAPTIPPVAVPVEPKVTVLPPKQRREHKARPRPVFNEPRALAASIPTSPVFVPRPAASALQIEQPSPMVNIQSTSLESVIRQNLLA